MATFLDDVQVMKVDGIMKKGSEALHVCLNIGSCPFISVRKKVRIIMKNTWEYHTIHWKISEAFVLHYIAGSLTSQDSKEALSLMCQQGLIVETLALS